MTNRELINQIENAMNSLRQDFDKLAYEIIKMCKKAGIPIPPEFSNADDPLTNFVNSPEQNSTQLNKK